MIFSKYPQITYAVSTVQNGNISPRFGNKQKALSNRKKFLKKVKVSENSLIQPTQIHSNIVKKVTRNNLDLNGDGLITNDKNLFLLIEQADCFAIALFDPNNEAIALIHAGRPGLSNGIIENAINLMKQEFNTNSADLLAQLSPSIGPCCYLLDGQTPQLFDPKWRKFVKKRGQKYSFDLWQFAENNLLELGLAKENIENPRICTYHHPNYFSHREAVEKNEPEYRFATIFGLKNV